MPALGAKVTDPNLLAALNGTAAPAAAQPAGFPGGSVMDPTKQWHTLTDDEVATEKLDPAFRWRRNAADQTEKIGEADPRIKTASGVRSLLTMGGIDLEKGIDPISPLISQSTSGMVEAIGARLKGAASGVATPGAVAIAKLEPTVNAMTLALTGGSLGNQISNTDRDFIVGQLGNVADPTQPANARLAAWESVKQRFANIMGVPYKPWSPPPATDQQQGQDQQQDDQKVAEPNWKQGPGDIGFNTPATPANENPWSGEQQASWDAFLQAHPKAAAAQINDWASAHKTQVLNADKIEEALKQGGTAGPGSSVQTGETPEEKAKVQATVKAGGYSGAFGAAAVEAVPFVDKALDAVNAVLDEQGGTLGERYKRQRRIGEETRDEFANQYPGTTIAGELGTLAAFTPTAIESVGLKAATEIIRAGGTRAEALGAARTAIMKQMSLESGALGGATGASEADNPGQIIPSTLTGALEGATGGAVLGAAGKVAPPVAQWVASKAGPIARRGIDAVDTAAARAGEALGIDVPRAIVGGPDERGKGQNLLKGGAPEMTNALSQLLDQSEAKVSGLAADVGTAGDELSLGVAGAKGGKAQVKGAKNRVDNLYAAARTAAGDESIPAPKAWQAMNEVAEKEAEAIGGSKIGDVFKELADDLAVNKKGLMTIDGARLTRTTLRNRLTNEAGLTPSNATRLTNHVMRALGEDIEDGLKAQGKDSAVALFKKADREWRKQMLLEDHVLEPYLGKNGEFDANQVASQLMEDVGNRGVRLARFLNAIPEERANAIRATLIDRLGRPPAGQQNAAGDAFSLDQFLTNWNRIKGARNLIFPKETRDSLDKMAQIAEAHKRFTKAKEPSGRYAAAAAKGALPVAGAALGGAAGYGLGGGWGSAGGGTVGAVLLPVLGALGKGRAARLLANPKFAARLAKMPQNPAAAKAYWERPWVAALARTNPELTNEILEFRDKALDALGQGDQTAPQAK